MKKKKPKTYCQREHFKRRLWERYGLSINRHEYRDIVVAIQSNQFAFLERESNRVTIWLGIVQGVHVPIVYDSMRKTAVTALPSEYLTKDGTNDSSVSCGVLQ
jgi:hypothetical protein